MKREREMKISIPKQMLHSLPIVTASVKADNPLENLLNKIRQVTLTLY